jgi:hypothetical protein
MHQLDSRLLTYVYRVCSGIKELADKHDVSETLKTI